MTRNSLAFVGFVDATDGSTAYYYEWSDGLYIGVRVERIVDGSVTEKINAYIARSSEVDPFLIRAQRGGTDTYTVCIPSASGLRYEPHVNRQQDDDVTTRRLT